VGRFADGRLAETFITNGKAGSTWRQMRNVIER
jgi:hypothetical protein